MIKRLIRKISSSFLNILGIAVGFSCFIIIAIWVYNERSYDSFNKDVELIYRISRHETSPNGSVSNSATTPSPLGPTLMNNIPEISSFTRFYRIESFLGEIQIEYQDNKFFENNYCFADTAFFSIFNFPFIYGNSVDALNDPNSVVITEGMASKYFKDENPMGKVIKISQFGEYIVTGVIKNIPVNSHIRFDFISPIKPLLDRYEWMNRWNIPHFYTYITIMDGIEPVVIKQKTDKLIAEMQIEQLSALGTIFTFQPITDIHLLSELDNELKGNSKEILKTIRIFLVFASFVLLISCLNFMIIFIAKAFESKKEIGIRKTFGAGRINIAKVYYSTTFLLIVIGFIIGLLLVIGLIPAFNSFIGLNLEIARLGNFRLLLILGLVILLSSLISGVYPALYISSFNPALIIRGCLSKKNKKRGLIKSFVIVQYVLSLFFIIGSIVYYSQYRYMISKDLGYDYNRVYCIRNNKEIKEQFDAFKATIQDFPSVAQVTSCSNLPIGSTNRTIVKNWEGSGADDQILMTFIYTDEDYIDALSITILKGRNFEFESDEIDGFIINEKAQKLMGLDNPIDKEFNLNGINGKIIGVVQDFNHGSLVGNIDPLVLKVNNNYTKFILVSLVGENQKETLEYIKAKYNDFSSLYYFEAWPLESEIQNLYQDDHRASRLIMLFSFLGILIASFGLYGLIQYSLNLRIKEIGIRKVLGALPYSIVNIFFKEYGFIILIASFIAWLTAYFYFNSWLDNYAFRVSMKIWYLVAASLISLILTSIIILVNTYYTAVTNPSKLISSE